MGKEENIEKERMDYESDAVWFARKAFLMRHWDNVPRSHLICLSQLFINVNIIGCEYNPSLMRRIEEMGTGIMEKAKKFQNERKFVKASEGRAKAEETINAIAAARYQRSAPKVFGMTDKLKQIKITILQADHKSSAFDMLSLSTGKAHMYWKQVEVGGATEIQISNLIVFRYKFIQPEVDSKECAVNAVVETFLHGGEPSIIDNLITFDGATPDHCYHNSLLRSLSKAQKLIRKDKTYKALSEILARVNLSVSQHATHLQGWSQKLDIRAGDLLLASRILTKGECVKAKFDAAVDEMSAKICNIIRDGPINIVTDEQGLILRY